VSVVVLAGGTGGAKLAAGMQDVVGEELTVIANTGDDVQLLGAYVSPDPDLCTYWLTGEIDEERGWGIRGDRFTVFERLVELGEPDWFSLGDRDLATCIRRRQMLEQGMRLTEVQLHLSQSLGARARVLPMCDQRVGTLIHTPDGVREIQEYFIKYRAEPEIEGVELEGIEEAGMSDEVATALAESDAIVIGPSNPVISIGPILAVPGMRGAIGSSPAPVVAVSPFVAGKTVKGPTEKCLRGVGEQPSASGVAALYGGLLDGFVADAGDPEPPRTDVATLQIPTLMDSRAARRELAERTLAFARELA
jgi:LPPG:FO 2-phospho-L-lactate transferase